MKKLLTMLVLVPLMVLADTVYVGNVRWTFKVNGGEVTVEKADPSAGMLVIPATLCGCPVTGIGAAAFYGCSGLTSVTIPSSVTSIGDDAFVGCSGLTSVTIPSSVMSIGREAFCLCSGLTSVTIPEGVTNIGGRAFMECSGLMSVTIPSSVTSIGAHAFSRCSGLTSVTIPEGVTSIGADAFSSCSVLTSISVNEGNAFYCSVDGVLCNKAMTELVCCPMGKVGGVTIPEGVTNIGGRAFADCSRLTSVTIPSSVTSIGKSAFYGCSGLTSVTIPSSVTSIGDYAFFGCSGLTSVTIPSSVTSIGEPAFYGCESLDTVYVSAGDIERVKAMIVNSKSDIDVDSLTFVEVLKDGGPYTETVNGIEWTFMVENGMASVGTGNGAAIPRETSGAIVIPSTLGCRSVTSIGMGAFYGCDGLTSVTIPSSVTSIGVHAFDGCDGLTSVTSPEGVTSIGDYAFKQCRSLTSVTIPSSVTSIGDGAFADCSGLTSVTIPSSVTSIGDLAFCYCSGLISVTIPEGVTSIGDGAFAYCGGLTSVTIPSSVTSIGDLAFADCSRLTSVTIPSSVTSIGNSAFYGCSGLMSVTIPSSVTSIGDDAFADCSGLMSVTIPSSVTSVGSNVFPVSLRRVNFSGAVPKGWTGVLPAPATKFYYNKDYASEWEKAQGIAGIPGDGTPYDVTTSEIVPQVAGCVTVSNVVVHYILNSVQPQFAIQPADDMNFVNIITEVKGSAAVAIPETWAASYPGFAQKFGTDFTQALMKPTGKIGTGGTPMLVWQDYVAGTDPTDENDVFSASITIVDGKVTVSYTPELDDVRKAMRKYTTWGKRSLLDTDWTEVQKGRESEYNFFKVSVEMK